FPLEKPSSRENFLIFLAAVLGSFFLMAAINFMIGTCAIPLKSILALIRAKQWLVELLSGLPFEHVAYTPLQIYLGKLDRAHALRALATEWFWVFALMILAHLWWNRTLRTITIQG